jgi:hypothetical protein
MTEDEAFDSFSKWYEACLDGGIEPNDVIQKMGAMFLLTDEEMIDRLKNEGVI